MAKFYIRTALASFDGAEITSDGHWEVNGDPSGHRFLLKGTDLEICNEDGETIGALVVDRDYDLGDDDDLKELIDWVRQQIKNGLV